VTRRVVITGMGAVSALGSTPDALWRGVVEGRSGVQRLPRMVAAGVNVTTGGEVTCVPHDRADRDEVMARRAIDDALDQAGVAAPDVGFVWGTGLDTFQLTPGGAVLRSAGACFSALAARHGRPRRMVAMACATGTAAIGAAFELVRDGRVDACVAGGSSVMLTPFYLKGFAALGAAATRPSQSAWMTGERRRIAAASCFRPIPPRLSVTIDTTLSARRRAGL